MRNALLHYRLADGRTYVERERLVDRVKELMWTDPSSLVAEDRALLDEDFEKLGAADAHDQAYWIAEVEAAIAYAQLEHVQARSRGYERSTAAPPRPPTTAAPTRVVPPEDDPEVDSEGSLRYRRRRRK